MLKRFKRHSVGEPDDHSDLVVTSEGVEEGSNLRCEPVAGSRVGGQNDKEETGEDRDLEWSHSEIGLAGLGNSGPR